MIIIKILGTKHKLSHRKPFSECNNQSFVKCLMSIPT